MRNIAAIILLFILSCKYNDDKVVIQKKSKEVQIEKNNKASENFKNDCTQIILNLIKGSNLKNPFKENLKFEIIHHNAVNMKLRLYDANDKLENTVGWIVFDAENMRLLDVTNDEENPQKLEFDKVLWNKTISCFFDNDKSFCFDTNVEGIKNEDCKTTMIDMDNIEECLFKNTNIKAVYSKLIKEHLVNDSEFFKKILPKSSENVVVNQKGIIDVDYKVINDGEIEINVNYQGGVTVIKMQKINNDVKQIITYSAD
jgi:hypothetical protein